MYVSDKIQKYTLREMDIYMYSSTSEIVVKYYTVIVAKWSKVSEIKIYKEKNELVRFYY